MAGYSRREMLCVLGGLALGAGAGAAWNAGKGDDEASEGPIMLRPPGAIPGGEDAFLAACIRCGLCVESCPDEVLKFTDLSAGEAGATPYFIARTKACTLCEHEEDGRLRCTEACPTAALTPPETKAAVKIGVAVINPRTCRPFVGRGCPRPCWRECPFINEAIQLHHPRNRPVVIADRCVGCGICEDRCVTTPSSIVIQPLGAQA